MINNQEKGKGKKEKGRYYLIKTILPFTLYLLPFTLLLSSCKSPFDRTRDASGGGALGTFSTGGTLVVFSSELKTGGGAFLYPAGDNQTLSFNDTSNPVSDRSIRYHWNGRTVAGQHLFAGFDLMHTPTQATYTSTGGRDLRQAGYTKVRFYARGSLSSNTLIKIEVADDGNTGTPAPCVSLSESGTLDDGVNTGSTACGSVGRITGSWQTYEVPIANTNLLGLKDFFKATFIYNQPGGNIAGSGGTVYFDGIHYAP